jgi:hypothetical protein
VPGHRVRTHEERHRDKEGDEEQGAEVGPDPEDDGERSEHRHQAAERHEQSGRRDSIHMHAFWRETDEQMKANQMAHFMKNLALTGGALVLFYAYNQLQGDAGLSITDPLFARG